MVNSLGLGIGGAVIGAVGIGLIGFGAYKRFSAKDYNIIYILLVVAGVIFLGVSIFMMVKGFGGGGKAKVLEQNIMAGAYGQPPQNRGYIPMNQGYSSMSYPGSPMNQGYSPMSYPGSPGMQSMYPGSQGYSPMSYPGTMPPSYGFPVPQ